MNGEEKPMANTQSGNDGRMTGKDALRDMARRFRKRADAIDALADMLPEKPSAEQNDAIFQVAFDLRHPL